MAIWLSALALHVEVPQNENLIEIRNRVKPRLSDPGFNENPDLMSFIQ